MTEPRTTIDQDRDAIDRIPTGQIEQARDRAARLGLSRSVANYDTILAARRHDASQPERTPR